MARRNAAPDFAPEDAEMRQASVVVPSVLPWLLVFLFGLFCHIPPASCLSQGMMGAVKKKVDKLDKKVQEQARPASGTSATIVVVGQPNTASAGANQGGAAANTLSFPAGVSSQGTKLFVADSWNNRVLIYNAIPTSNNVSADVVVGQPNMAVTAANQGGGGQAHTLAGPQSVFSDGTRLFVADRDNNRVLIYNPIPTTDNRGANLVVGQPNLTSTFCNQGIGTARNPIGPRH
jgi:hypothetical protein